MTDSDRPGATGEAGTDAADPNASGLADPGRAITAMGASVVALESLVLLLCLVPLRMLRVEPLWPAVTLVLVLTVVCVVLAAFMRRRWAWYAAAGVQVVLLAAGLLHWSLAAVGLIFGLTWWFAVSIRRRLSRPPVRDDA
ncbi:uncharacterized protein DUF4233 [Stackebrandtia albiflava]|uniref:Uncharacterized protein DUF4233 n=1 Tax=Stackebrandtia albiflava TaxID=406432 RepID=A0A562URV1_9ACTN|nr:DUF4233 domain-containing protein [Stackebrandtia albiflava]TWJ08341.1 uncharacterized protein DUF4233 [Stackebrandtia albiflava]